MIILDTSVLPRYGTSLRNNVIICALLHIAVRKNIVVGIPDVCLEESVNARIEEAGAKLLKLRTAINQASKYVELADIYLPDPQDVANQWREALAGSFVIVPLACEDAVEALHREAQRRKPARSGTGARDCAIWLTVKRIGLTATERVDFVSNNTEDFADPHDKSRLHPELLADLGDRDGSVCYFRSVPDLLAEIAPEIAYDPTVDDLNSEALRPKLLEEMFVGGFLDEMGIGELDGAVSVEVVVEQARSLRAYQVDADGVALLDLRLRVVFENAFGVPGSVISQRRVSGEARAWVEFDLSDRSARGVSIERIIVAEADT